MANTDGDDTLGGGSSGEDWYLDWSKLGDLLGQDDSSLSWDAVRGSFPDWLGGNLGSLKEFLTVGPRNFIRRVIASEILRAIAYFLTPIITALVYLFLGSNPTEFAAPDEQLGLFDLPVWGVEKFSEGLLWASGAYWDAVTGLAVGIVPDLPGPIDGVLATLVVVVVTAAAAELSRRLLLAVALGLADLDPTGLGTAALTAIGVHK